MLVPEKLLLWLKELSRKSNKELKLIDFSFPHLQKKQQANYGCGLSEIKKARQESSDENQARRLTLALQNLSNADIGTMDSFTQKLTKTNFNRVNIDPNFES